MQKAHNILRCRSSNKINRITWITDRVVVGNNGKCVLENGAGDENKSRIRFHSINTTGSSDINAFDVAHINGGFRNAHHRYGAHSRMAVPLLEHNNKLRGLIFPSIKFHAISFVHSLHSSLIAIDNNYHLRLFPRQSGNHQFEFNRMEMNFFNGFVCCLWMRSKGELKCRCEGMSLVRIPQRLHASMQSLVISDAGLKLLRASGLKVYGSSLQDM